MIWIIGGTKDSRIIAEKISKFKFELIVSTATEYGKKLLSDLGISIISKRLNENEMNNFIKEKNITLIIDASHPYAENVSQQAILISKKNNIRYIRFERKSLDYSEALRFSNLKELIQYLNKNYFGKNILSTFGSKNLKELLEIKNNHLYIRILPTTTSIKYAEELGYLPKNIIALQGSFSKEFNKSMIKNYNVDLLLTKESGQIGGELEKIQACKDTHVQILTLKRPNINYPKVFNEINKLIDYVYSQ